MKAINIPDIPARQLAGWMLAVTAVMACFWLLWRFQDVLLLLVTALILSPAVLWLEKRGIPKPAFSTDTPLSGKAEAALPAGPEMRSKEVIY